MGKRGLTKSCFAGSDQTATSPKASHAISTDSQCMTRREMLILSGLTLGGLALEGLSSSNRVHAAEKENLQQYLSKLFQKDRPIKTDVNDAIEKLYNEYFFVAEGDWCPAVRRIPNCIPVVVPPFTEEQSGRFNRGESIVLDREKQSETYNFITAYRGIAILKGRLEDPTIPLPPAVDFTGEWSKWLSRLSKAQKGRMDKNGLDIIKMLKKRSREDLPAIASKIIQDLSQPQKGGGVPMFQLWPEGDKNKNILKDNGVVRISKDGNFASISDDPDYVSKLPLKEQEIHVKSPMFYVWLKRSELIERMHPHFQNAPYPVIAYYNGEQLTENEVPHFGITIGRINKDGSMTNVTHDPYWVRLFAKEEAILDQEERQLFGGKYLAVPEEKKLYKKTPSGWESVDIATLHQQPGYQRDAQPVIKKITGKTTHLFRYLDPEKAWQQWQAKHKK